MPKIFRKVGSFFLDLIEITVMAMAIFVVVYLFLFQPHSVQGNSMLPNFHNKEYILTDKVSYRFSQPQRGDVIIFKAPGNEDYEYIKRIVGLPGEQVKISEGKVYINDQLLNELYLPADLPTRPGFFAAEGKAVIIPANQYFVLGDNRLHSSDSRDWGPVPQQNIVGKAWFRYWPMDQLGLIPEEKY